MFDSAVSDITLTLLKPASSSVRIAVSSRSKTLWKCTQTWNSHCAKNVIGFQQSDHSELLNLLTSFSQRRPSSCTGCLLNFAGFCGWKTHQIFVWNRYSEGARTFPAILHRYFCIDRRQWPTDDPPERHCAESPVWNRRSSRESSRYSVAHMRVRWPRKLDHPCWKRAVHGALDSVGWVVEIFHRLISAKRYRKKNWVSRNLC